MRSSTDSQISQPNNLATTRSKDKEMDEKKKLQHDGADIESAAHIDVQNGDAGIFGGENGENYRTMGRWGTLFAMTTNQLGLGFLSLPGAMMVLGLVPGVISILVFGTITWYAGHLVYQYHCRYPHVVNIVDMVRILGGRYAAAVAGFFLLVQLIMTGASAVVTLSIAFNTLSGHSICTVGFIGIGCLVCFVLCIPRSMKFIAHSGAPCFASIFAAGMIVIISLGISSPAQAPEGWSGADIKIVGTPTFREGFNACLRVIYSFAGNVVYASFMAEMRDPVKDFPFALRGLLFVSVGIYSLVAISVYCLAGEYTTSPALGSAPRIPAKVAYGIIIPAILTTGLANGHIAVKYAYVQVMRGLRATDQVTKNTVKTWAIWIGLVTCYWILCFLISNAIPIFDSIVSISSATTFAWFTYGIPAMFWFHLNWSRFFTGWKKTALFLANVALLLGTFVMNGVGMWSSITALLDIFADENTAIRGAFDCGDNSLF